MHSPSRPCTPRYSSTRTSAEKPAAPSRHERPTTRSRSSGGRWRRPLLRPSTSCPSSSLRGVPAARSTARLPDAQQRLLARVHCLQQIRRRSQGSRKNYWPGAYSISCFSLLVAQDDEPCCVATLSGQSTHARDVPHTKQML